MPYGQETPFEQQLNEQINSSASEMLNVLREEALIKSGQNKGKFARGSDGKIQYVTGKDSPSAVYLREIPFMGVARAVKDLSSKSEPVQSVFDDLPLTEAAKVRVYKGLLILRQRFINKVAEDKAKLNKGAK